jgi:hypothetical protein
MLQSTAGITKAIFIICCWQTSLLRGRLTYTIYKGKLQV